jgi:hypothetical protein
MNYELPAETSLVCDGPVDVHRTNLTEIRQRLLNAMERLRSRMNASGLRKGGVSRRRFDV